MDHSVARHGAPLSPREREVLVWSAKGLSRGEVGSKLGLAETTVGNYLRVAYLKLDVSGATRSGSMIAAFRKLGWLRPR